MNPFAKNSVESFRDRPEFQGWLIDFADRLVSETNDASSALNAMKESSLNHHVGVWGQAKWMRSLNILNSDHDAKTLTDGPTTPEARQAVMDAYYSAIDSNPGNAGIPPQFQKGWRAGIGSVVVADGLESSDSIPTQPHDYLADNVFSIESASSRVSAAFDPQQSVAPIAPYMGAEKDAA